MKRRTPEQIARECVRVRGQTIRARVGDGRWLSVYYADGWYTFVAGESVIRRAIARAIRLDRQQRTKGKGT